jgi:hypothetical protein
VWPGRSTLLPTPYVESTTDLQSCVGVPLSSVRKQSGGVEGFGTDEMERNSLHRFVARHFRSDRPPRWDL